MSESTLQALRRTVPTRIWRMDPITGLIECNGSRKAWNRGLPVMASLLMDAHNMLIPEEENSDAIPDQR